MTVPLRWRIVLRRGAAWRGKVGSYRGNVGVVWGRRSGSRALLASLSADLDCRLSRVGSHQTRVAGVRGKVRGNVRGEARGKARGSVKMREGSAAPGQG